jgi:hypothetical protein
MICKSFAFIQFSADVYQKFSKDWIVVSPFLQADIAALKLTMEVCCASHETQSAPSSVTVSLSLLILV